MNRVTYLYRSIRRFYTLIEFLALGTSLVLGSSLGWLAMQGPLWVAVTGCGAGIVVSLGLASYTAAKLDGWFEVVSERAGVPA